MKTNLTFSNVQGKKDDAKLHTVSEFCRIVANETVSDIYGYFSNFYAAFLADSANEKKQENETVSDFRNRVMRKAYQQVKSTKTADLKNTELYKIFSSKNQLFKLVRTISPCFYDDEMKHKFAKRKVVALNVDKLTTEQVKDLTETGYKCFSVKRNDDKVFNLISKVFKTENGAFSAKETAEHYATMLNTQRKQRKDKFSEIREIGIYFFNEKGNVCTMVEHDKMNFRTMYAYISEYAQKQNFEKVQNQQEKEKREKTQRNLLKSTQKLDATVSTAFNKLVDFKMKTAKQYNEYVTDETKRNLLQADAIRLTTMYKDACKKRFSNWNEQENGLLADISAMVRKLTIDAPKQKKTTKTAKTKKAA